MKRISFLLIAFAAAISSSSSFATGLLYGTDGRTGDLVAIDTSNGSSVAIGDTGLEAALGVAYDPNNDLWYTRNFYNLYTLDIATAATSLVGPSGSGITGLAFDPTYSTLYSVNQNTGDFYTVDPATGTATFVGNTGVSTPLDLSTDAGGTLWAASYDGDIYTIDPATGIGTLVAAVVDNRGLTSISFDSYGNLYGVTLNGDMLVLIDPGAGTTSDVGGPIIRDDIRGMDFLGSLRPVEPKAFIKVTKKFTDGSDDEVDVTLTCNTGLPLKQTFTIAGGDPKGVTFVVTDIPEGGADCEVTESGGPNGYTPVLNGGDGCAWEGVISNVLHCEITNEAKPAKYTVVKDWVVEREGGLPVDAEADVTIKCDREIDGGWEHKGKWYKKGTLGDGDTLVATVDVSTDSATCSASERIGRSGVESSSSGCGEVELSAGGSQTCTFTNTVFYEGIPTLSQYGLALLALLTLGVGLVGIRRFA